MEQLILKILVVLVRLLCFSAFNEDFFLITLLESSGHFTSWGLSTYASLLFCQTATGTKHLFNASTLHLSTFISITSE